jgi:hypothetical protein
MVMMGGGYQRRRIGADSAAPHFPRDIYRVMEISDIPLSELRENLSTSTVKMVILLLRQRSQGP